MFGDRLESLIHEIPALQERYPHLHFRLSGGKMSLSGGLKFDRRYRRVRIADTYQIVVTIPPDYPCTIPTVAEVGGRISRHFHRFRDGSLCLGAPVEIASKFKRNPTLAGFLSNCVEDFLYNHSYYEKYGHMPWGELAHGRQGIEQYYRDRLGVSDHSIVLHLMAALVEGKDGWHAPCACGSGKRHRDCHGPQIRRVRAVLPMDLVRRDYDYLRGS